MGNEARKIFIADDDSDILSILELMLQTKGYQVAVSSTGQEVFSYRDDELPDLVLLDIWMSGIDGRDICAQLKNTPLTRHIPVLLISANSNIEAIAQEYCADGFIAKPFDMDELLDRVQEMLEVKI